MTSIVITPHEPEHAEELRDFIVNELDNADFQVDMPASVRLIDLNRLVTEREHFIMALGDMIQLAFDATQYATPKTDEGKRIQMLDRARIDKAIALLKVAKEDEQ